MRFTSDQRLEELKGNHLTEKTMHALVIDDEPQIRNFVGEVLQNAWLETEEVR